MNTQIKWFDRKFDFRDMLNSFPSTIERLRGTPVRLEEKTKTVSNKILDTKIDNSWSIKENIGHLTDLEPLWMGRLEDILSKSVYLRVADLQNQKTERANHNAQSIDALLGEFRLARLSTIQKLESLSKEELLLSALHPRLNTPMRTMDHFLFVAEHDDHHLVAINQIIQTLK